MGVILLWLVRNLCDMILLFLSTLGRFSQRAELANRRYDGPFAIDT